MSKNYKNEYLYGDDEDEEKTPLRWERYKKDKRNKDSEGDEKKDTNRPSERNR